MDKRSIAAKVLRNPNSSKVCKVKNGSALTQAWNIKRRTPYTEMGIARKQCIRCQDKAEYQWNICSDGGFYRPICAECDVELNRLVLNFMKHPKKDILSKLYRKLKLS